MNVSLLLAHPQPGSFNHAIAQVAREARAAAGHAVAFHDLCAERFEALLPPGESARDARLPPAIAAHCAENRGGGRHRDRPSQLVGPAAGDPQGLGGPRDPPGVAYEFLAGDSGEGVPRGLLKARAAVVFNTSNTAPERERAVFGDPLETLWRTASSACAA
jgi:hypothetical protein